MAALYIPKQNIENQSLVRSFCFPIFLDTILNTYICVVALQTSNVKCLLLPFLFSQFSYFINTTTNQHIVLATNICTYTLSLSLPLSLTPSFAPTLLTRKIFFVFVLLALFIKNFYLFRQKFKNDKFTQMFCVTIIICFVFCFFLMFFLLLLVFFFFFFN